MGYDGAMRRRNMARQRRFTPRWKRWGDKGVFVRMMEGLAAPQAPERKTVMIDATYLNAYCTASSLRVKKGKLDA